MKKKINRVTIKDIARLADVTPQTVSRALGNAPGVSAETKKKILQIADSLNYVKNSSAYAFRGGRTKLIAVFYDNFINLYFSIMMEYLQREFSKKGYSLLPLTARHGTLDESAYKQAVSYNVDGVVSFLLPEKGLADLIKTYGTPVLIFGRRCEESCVDCVYTDDFVGGNIVGRRFVEIGCGNVLYLTEPLSLTCAQDRFDGLKQTLLQNGKQEPRVAIYREKSMEEHFEGLKNSERGLPDAVFCFNDMIAFELLHLIEIKNLPEFKVIGYDAIQDDIKMPRQLTTVSSDKQWLVEQVVKIMIDKIENGVTARITAKNEVFLREGVTA